MLQGPRPWPWVGSFIFRNIHEPSERKHSRVRILKQWSTLNKGWHLLLLCALLSRACIKSDPLIKVYYCLIIWAQNSSSSWYFVSLIVVTFKLIPKTMKLLRYPPTQTETFRPHPNYGGWFLACILTSTRLEEWPNTRWSNPR